MNDHDTRLLQLGTITVQVAVGVRALALAQPVLIIDTTMVVLSSVTSLANAG